MAEVYNIGVGIADVTGPAAEIAMMGYAKLAQKTKGIHIRLYSRAFIFQSQDSQHSQSRVAFVSVDCGMMSQLVKICVIRSLQDIYPGVYSAENVLLSATHTHSGPSGFMQYVTYNITSMGFVKENKEVMVKGIVQSICRAHENLEPGHIYLSQGIIEDANINRSPTSYLANPVEERDRYSHDTDQEMVQLNLLSTSGRPMGVINWYAVHPNSMQNTNFLISGDNKGAASQMFEKEINKGYLTGKGPFVAAFATSNLGDVSPNLKGPHCMGTGLPCTASPDDGCNNNKCQSSGPGEDMFESTKIIAKRQFDMAKQLFNDKQNFVEVRGPVRFMHQFIDMSKYEMTQEDGSVMRTAKPALGYSFAAGTTDGPGEFDFIQGTLDTNPFWAVVSGLLRVPSNTQKTCHAPKPILLDTGEYLLPYAWHPTVVDPQLLNIGQVVIAGVPGEFTTMAGRRLRGSIGAAMDNANKDDNAPKTKVVIAGLSNTYTHYVTTVEEYQKQRYEAASTLYGPNTLMAYQHQYAKMATAMANGQVLPQGICTPDLESKQISFVPNVVLDHAPLGKKFGQCIEQPLDTVPGGQIITRFISGHLRNNPMLEKTFLTVERLVVDELGNSQRSKPRTKSEGSRHSNDSQGKGERRCRKDQDSDEEMVNSSLLCFQRKESESEKRQRKESETEKRQRKESETEKRQRKVSENEKRQRKESENEKRQRKGSENENEKRQRKGSENEKRLRKESEDEKRLRKESDDERKRRTESDGEKQLENELEEEKENDEENTQKEGTQNETDNNERKVSEGDEEMTYDIGEERKQRTESEMTYDMEDLADLDWEIVATDADWETKLEWVRTNAVLGESEVIITWDVPMDCVPGTYRISHFGYYKHLIKGEKPYQGKSQCFEVIGVTQDETKISSSAT